MYWYVHNKRRNFHFLKDIIPLFSPKSLNEKSMVPWECGLHHPEMNATCDVPFYQEYCTCMTGAAVVMAIISGTLSMYFNFCVVLQHQHLIFSSSAPTQKKNHTRLAKPSFKRAWLQFSWYNQCSPLGTCI